MKRYISGIHCVCLPLYEQFFADSFPMKTFDRGAIHSAPRWLSLSVSLTMATNKMRIFLMIICWKCEKENKFKQTLLWCTLASGPVHQWDGSCVMICSSSSQRKGAPTGVCCQTLQSIWVARRRSWALFQVWNMGTVQRHRVILSLWCVTTLEFHQLHLDVYRCSVHVNCKRITERFTSRDLVCHQLAAWKVTQVSLQHIHLPQTQLHTESGRGSIMSVITWSRP